MANREIEAILKISAKMGNLRALDVLNGELRKVEGQVKKINRAQTVMGAASAKVAGGLAMAGGALARVAAPAALGYGAMRAFKSYAEIERQIERIGITADASAEETAAAMDRLRGIAMDLHLPFQDVVEGMDTMVATGKTMKEAFALLPAVGKTAQASGAALTDMSTTADAVANSFGVMSDQMQRAFDILAYRGKEGKFELKDMAAELPSLAPAFAALGYKGLDGVNRLATALQVVRMETGQSGEAATAFMDVLTKMQSTATVANFKKFGVDLRGSMDRARKDGRDVLESFVKLSVQAVRGDLSKLPQLFTDKQMLIGMRALINHWDQYAASLKTVGQAVGTTDRDFKRLSKNVQASITDMSNSWDRFVTSVGKGMAPVITPILEGVSQRMEKSQAIEKGLIDQGLNAEQRYQWRQRATPAMRDAMAFKGGYRTAEQEALIEKSKEEGARRNYMEWTLRRLPNGMPVRPPLPTPRPSSSAEMDREAAGWAAGFDQMRAARAGEGAAKVKRALRESAATGIHGVTGATADEVSAVNGGAAALSRAMEGGAQDAGRSIEAAIAEGARQLAASIRDALRTPVQVNVNGAAAAGARVGAMVAPAPVNADLGRSNGGVRTGPQ